MALTDPESVVIAALLTGVLALLTAWIANRKAQPSPAPEPQTEDEVIVNDLIERICSVYERQIAWLEADIEQRKRADAERTGSAGGGP